MSDFDRIFEPQYRAVDLFTDRLHESEVFTNSLLRHVERVADGAAAFSQPRRNVLSFYGVGGIGKTELSRRLEQWVSGELDEQGEWGAPLRLDQEIITVRFDFHGSSAVDAADRVLRLRAAVASRIRRFPAFDIGLAAWWGSARPGTPLPEVRTSTGFDLKGQITDTLNDILSNAGARFGVGPLTIRTVDQITSAVLSHRRYRKALGECLPLEEVVDKARRDPSPYVAATLAGLLTWDLNRLHFAERPVLVAFADAVEYVQGGNRLQERLLNRIIHLTPGVLWVITSRDRLDWDVSALGAVLPAAGADVWPGLPVTAKDEPRQHLVGDLSDLDVVRFLRSASGAAGNPDLADEVIERIRVGAHGLPLYLDLSLDFARTAPRGPLDPADFGGQMPALVFRVFANLSQDERDLARTASLLPRFDPALIAHATGHPVGKARLFCNRSLVMPDSHPIFPFRLHDAVRSAVAGESAETQGAWNLEDRAARAVELVRALHDRHDSMGDDPRLRLDVLELVAYLCAAHDLRPSWLLGALIDLPGMARTAAQLPAPDETTWMGEVSKFFGGWRDRNARERIEYLSGLTNSLHAPDVSEAARRWLGFSYNLIRNYDKSLEIFRSLLSEKPDSDLFRYQVGRSLRQLGRYDDLDRHMREFPIDDESMNFRQRSDLAYDRGEILPAIEGAAFRAARLESRGKFRVALENEAVALWRASVAGGLSVMRCDEVIAKADRYGDRAAMRTALAAKALCLLGSASVGEVFSEMSDLIASASGVRGWREWNTELLHAISKGDREQIERVRREWESTVRPWTPYLQTVDYVFTFAGYPATYPPIGIGNANEVSQIKRRWHGIIQEITTNARRVR